MRTLALVDGEHYPPVTRWAHRDRPLAGLRRRRRVIVGGIEKLAPARPRTSACRVRSVGDDRAAALARRDRRPAARRRAGSVGRAGARVPRADGGRRRGARAGRALRRRRTSGSIPGGGAAAIGTPTLAVFGTGKRTGKTAVAGEVARIAARRGLAPVVVAMGRGGPPEPQVAEAGSVTLETLLGLVRDGRARRVGLPRGRADDRGHDDRRPPGGGGARRRAVRHATWARRCALAAERDPGLAHPGGERGLVPPIAWDAGVLVVPATCPPEYVRGYLGPYRLLRADLAVVTMAGGPVSGRRTAPNSLAHLQGSLGDAGSW